MDLSRGLRSTNGKPRLTGPASNAVGSQISLPSIESQNIVSIPRRTPAVILCEGISIPVVQPGWAYLPRAIDPTRSFGIRDVVLPWNGLWTPGSRPKRPVWTTGTRDPKADCAPRQLAN